ncbi:MAG: GTP-binding protein [Candidatus Hodarchaeota archaeon]
MILSRKYFYKVCIVGDSEVGKTTLLHQYLLRRFISDAERTIGSNFFVKYLKFPEIKNIITLQVWDLAGQDHFQWVRHAFYKGVKGIVYVFDLTRKNTFENIRKWKEEVESKAGILPNVLVGNKVDLLNATNLNLKKEQAIELKEYLSSCFFFEASAKEGINVDEIFFELTKEMIKKYDS